jgi:hypothetical protein
MARTSPCSQYRHNRAHYQKAKHIAKITNTSVYLWMEGSPEDMQAALYSIKEVA